MPPEFLENESDLKESGGVVDLARKILLTGVGAIFMGEETVRKSLSDLKLPTDTVGSLLESLKKQKDEITHLIAEEVRGFLTKIRVHEELQKALKGMQIHVDAKISFDQKTGKAKSSVSVREN